ncbi:MAG: Fic family protein, partial [Candidatus Xenobia bacterium]
MSTDEQVKEAAKIMVEDRGEAPSGMEPLVLSEGSRHRGAVSDLAVELAAASSGFRRSLPPGIVGPLADLVRGMNCYYSNLIEGHNTHPVDIERAMKNDYSGDPEKRHLQLEARAHVAVQRWVDEGGIKGQTTTVEAICEIHRRFSALLPEELLVVSDPDSGRTVNVVAGELRRDDVKVGRHLAISPGAVARFMTRFEQA